MKKDKKVYIVIGRELLPLSQTKIIGIYENIEKAAQEAENFLKMQEQFFDCYYTYYIKPYKLNEEFKYT